jgi:hypothetical protein
MGDFLLSQLLRCSWLDFGGRRNTSREQITVKTHSSLAATKVPLVYRVLYGFMHREGIRRVEAERMTWA